MPEDFMKLSYRYFGGEGKEPLVILHGLLGSSRNWTNIGKALAERFEVFAVDLRNHGDSPHAPEMDFDSLARDVVDFFDEQDIGRAHLMGHSLGGKVAMHLAVNFFRRVESLVVVDIAPKDYPPYHLDDFNAMNQLDLDSLANRKQADEFLTGLVPDFGQRQFLLTNLKREKDGSFHWGINLKVLTESLDVMRRNSLEAEDRFTGPTLFVLGEHSRFVRDDDHSKIREHFPRAVIKMIPESGHNPHIDQPKALLAALEDFAKVDWGCEI